MFISNPFDALAAAHAHGRELRAQAAAERLFGTSGTPTRRAIAVALRRAADRLDPAALAPRRPFSSETRVKEA